MCKLERMARVQEEVKGGEKDNLKLRKRMKNRNNNNNININSKGNNATVAH